MVGRMGSVGCHLSGPHRVTFTLATPLHQRDKQTERRTPHDSKDRAIWVASRGKHLCIQSLCCFNCLFLLYSTHKRLFGLIHSVEKDQKINIRKACTLIKKLEITSQQRTVLNLDRLNKNLSKLSAGMLRQGGNIE